MSWSSCPPSTSPTARPSAWCRGRPAARRPTAIRSRRRSRGSATAPSGCTSSTSTPPSAAAAIASGWTREGGELYETLARLDAEGCARYVVTDITKDGTLRGPNLDLLREVCAATPRPVVASGGVSSLDDIRALAGLTPVGVEGAIVGKALYAGAFTLPEALRVTEGIA